MKRKIIYPLAALLCLIFLQGCVSAGSSPKARFYAVRSADKAAVTETFNVPEGLVIAVGPVKIADYLNRPQIVTLNNDNMLKFAEFDRWGESVDFALARVLNENLSLMLPQVSIEMFPWNLMMPVRYQVSLDVIGLDLRLDKGLVLSVQWSIINLDAKKMEVTRRFQISEDIKPDNYAGAADALGKAYAALSLEIAREVSVLANNPQD